MPIVCLIQMSSFDISDGIGEFLPSLFLVDLWIVGIFNRVLNRGKRAARSLQVATRFRTNE